MNKEQKAAVVERVADEIQQADAIFAIDYRGLSVKQAKDLRTSLGDAGASFQVVKNTLTELAADRAGAESLKAYLEGPTALTFVRGDVAVAAKALATFRRQQGLLEFKGGQMDGAALTAEQIESIARLPARDVLNGQFVGLVASPLTGLVRGLAGLIGGLASQLQQTQEQGLVTGSAPAAEPAAAEPEPAAEPAAAAEEPAAAPAGDDGETASEAPGDPVAEGEAAETETEADAAGGGDTEQEG